MSRVLLGCFPPDALADVRDALILAGCEVESQEDVEELVRHARAFELLVVTDLLHGGSGTDVLAVLDGFEGRPKTLYVGPEEVPGADAVVSGEDVNEIVVAGLKLLGREVDETLGWQVRTNPLADVTAGGTVMGKNGHGPNGGAKPDPARFEALLRRVRECDYFEILGLTTEATDAEVRSAHAALAAEVKRFGRVPHLQEVESALEEALDVLSEPSLRAAYARHRI